MRNRARLCRWYPQLGLCPMGLSPFIISKHHLTPLMQSQLKKRVNCDFRLCGLVENTISVQPKNLRQFRPCGLVVFGLK
ncbi:hypothetical protein Hanom_Chr04g00320351 [Helianthus anomalus]